jgi:hypothetical protein
MISPQLKDGVEHRDLISIKIPDSESPRQHNELGGFLKFFGN